MENCNGYGECLLQCDNNGYSKNYDILCTHNCFPVKCQNFEICGSSFPKMYIGCWGGNGCCMNCDILFGKWNGGKGILKIGEINKECCVCLEDRKLVSLPKCIHEVCIECFPKIYFNEEDEYDDDDSLIRIGNKATNTCPLCRKC